MSKKVGSPKSPVPAKVPVRLKLPPRYWLVNENETLSVEQVKKLIGDDYTHYRFPDGTCPKVLPITGWKCQGIKLIYDEFMGQYMWIGLMASDWAPVDTHKS